MKSTLSVAITLLVVAAPGVLRPPVSSAAFADNSLAQLRTGFLNPPMECRPHTRWWWMGNATTKEDLTWELEQMHQQGLGGVEQITMQEVYEKGNHPYLSAEYLDLIVHAIREAQRLGMEFSLNFGGPGWVIGGHWVPQEDRSRNMLSSSVELRGPHTFSGNLPTDATLNPRDLPRSRPKIRPEDRLLAVVAGRIVDGRLRESSLVDITSNVNGRTLTWDVPEGRWRVMAFWLTFTRQGTTVDHFNKAAMERYCDYLGGRFRAAFGDQFGKTVESFFCDSFEVAIFRNGIYWNAFLLEQFKAQKGYDLTRYLPAIWWKIDDISPKIRYDVNEFLHHVGLEAFFNTFLGWCEANGVKGRIQPYGFTTDILEGAGKTHLPEMEITAGEKDAVPWFDTRIGPKKYVASGAHLYGRNIVTVEAYTYLHWEPYRATLEELKIASDVFLRCGANKFYNHGFTSSPERDIAPSRRFGAEMLVSPPNVWWKHYRLLSDYVARCCYMLRQGSFTADVVVYSPLANQWTLDALNARKWTRNFDWGELGKLLIGGGYDFDLINDDVLQNHARIDRDTIRVRNLQYRILILPNIQALPLKSMERIQEYVRRGGVAIALERIPDSSVGFTQYQQRDAKVRSIAREMFRRPQGRDGTGPNEYGRGRTYFIKRVLDRSDVLDWRSSALDPFLQTLRHHLPPDFAIDFAHQGLRENEGLTFVHRKLDAEDLYFVTNIQDRPSRVPVTFRVKGKVPWRWNPYNGKVSPIFHYRRNRDGTEVPLRLAPYESTFLLFSSRNRDLHVVGSDFAEIIGLTEHSVEALADENGNLRVVLAREGRTSARTAAVNDLPAPFVVTGQWTLSLQGRNFPKLEKTLVHLTSWTKDPAMRHFSGTGRYEIRFTLPDPYRADDLQLQLDLGEVGNVAEVALNGAAAGIRWMRGQTLDVTDYLRPGANHLVVLVTNTLINRVSGLKEPPPVPEELVPRYGRGTTAHSDRARGSIGFKPLPASGLMGPVKIIAHKRVTLAVK